MAGKIPVRFRDEFFAAMRDNDDESLEDGAWFQKLEDVAARFIKSHKLQWIFANDAVMQYVKLTFTEKKDEADTTQEVSSEVASEGRMVLAQENSACNADALSEACV